MVDASVVLKLVDRTGDGFSAVRRASDQTGRSFDALAAKVTALRAKNKSLNESYAELQVQITDARRAVSEAARAYKANSDDVNSASLKNAQEQYKELTDLVAAQTVREVSPTSGFVNAGTMIIAKDELVTASTAQILDSYKAEYEASMGYNGPKIVIWIGNAMIALALLTILWFVIFFTNRKILEDPARLSYLLFIFLVTTIAALGVERIDSDYLFMVPFTLSSLWLQAFFRNKVSPKLRRNKNKSKSKIRERFKKRNQRGKK